MISAPKQTEVFEKLVTLARGDLDLVQNAIWRASEQGKKRADLKAVVEYIVAHQNRYGHRRERVAA